MADLADFIRDHTGEIYDAYVALVYSRVARYTERQPSTFPENTRRMIELIPIAHEDPDSPAVRQFVDALCQQRLPAGFQLADILEAMFLYNDVILPLLQDEIADTTVRERMLVDLDNAVEQIALRLSRAFVAMQVSLIEAQRQAVLELSTPVIKVWDGILALPLIGTIDSDRARQIMEELLKAIGSEQAAIVLIDITGVPVVDTNVADHLMKTVRAAELLGAECLLVGVGADLAQTLVGLGVELRHVSTSADMRSGLTLAFEKLGLRVTSR